MHTYVKGGPFILGFSSFCLVFFSRVGGFFGFLAFVAFSFGGFSFRILCIHSSSLLGFCGFCGLSFSHPLHYQLLSGRWLSGFGFSHPLLSQLVFGLGFLHPQQRQFLSGAPHPAFDKNAPLPNNSPPPPLLFRLFAPN